MKANGEMGRVWKHDRDKGTRAKEGVWVEDDGEGGEPE